ncbi:MAG: replication-associated recombination protein A [Chitinophagales bacterium]
MDLFDHAALSRDDEPLAARMRPRTLADFVGQAHLVGPGKLLRRMIEADRVPSLIFYGPPGTGKTTLARIIAASTHCQFEQLNAVSSGVSEVRKLLAEAEDRRKLQGRRTILFIDELHRFNKAQQDALLKAVEEGVVTFIGATTENPFFSVIGPLLSRARLFRLEPLTREDLLELGRRALADRERGLGGTPIEVTEEALAHLVECADGDGRAFLTALELAVRSTEPVSGVIRVDLEVAQESCQRRILRYDRDGDLHYDAASAFIKSMRGSDPDAALYWMARMLEAGEDPRFVARRIVIHAAEDVGNADPRALLVAVAAAQALEMLGLPEARIPLAQAALYVATAPKSNSVVAAIDAAQATVQAAQDDQVPAHLRDASYRGAARLGHGQGYLYPHDFPEHWVAQRYLPENLQDAEFYHPSGSGYEATIAERLKRKNFTR